MTIAFQFFLSIVSGLVSVYVYERYVFYDARKFYKTYEKRYVQRRKGDAGEIMWHNVELRIIKNSLDIEVFLTKSNSDDSAVLYLKGTRDMATNLKGGYKHMCGDNILWGEYDLYLSNDGKIVGYNHYINKDQKHHLIAVEWVPE